MIESTISQYINQRPGRSGFLVPRTKDDDGDSRGENRTGAHDARFERDDQGAALEAPLTARCRCSSNRKHLGVRSGVTWRSAAC